VRATHGAHREGRTLAHSAHRRLGSKKEERLNYSRKHSLALTPFASMLSARSADALMVHMSTIVNTDSIFVGSAFISRRTDLQSQPIVAAGTSSQKRTPR